MAATVAAAEELGRGAAVIGFTNRWRCADGSYRWLDWLVSPHDGLWYAVARDVTERRSEVGGMAAQGRSVQTAKLAALGQMVAWWRTRSTTRCRSSPTTWRCSSATSG
jgi:hypothetical protein